MPSDVDPAGESPDRFQRIEALAQSRQAAQRWDYEGWRAAGADEKAVGS